MADKTANKTEEKSAIPLQLYGSLKNDSKLMDKKVEYREEREHGLSICTAAVFIMSEILGSGILTFPWALLRSGWIGVPIMLIIGLICIYTTSLLGKSWLIVQERHPEYRGPFRYPYPALASVTHGKAGRLLVQISINFTLVGVAVVFMLIAAQNIHNLVSFAGLRLSFCYWLLIVALVLIPFTWLGTPKDFGFIAIGSVGSSIIGGCVLVATLFIDLQHQEWGPFYESPTFLSLASSFGTMMFAFGGHPVYPTIQNDMKDTSKLGFSGAIAYLSTLAILVPISIFGYVLFGDFVKTNVLLNLPKGGAVIAVQTMVTGHLLFAYVIFINPVNQDIEDMWRIPTTFTWKRALSRTCLVLGTLLIAETIPKFGAILSLIGGTTYNILGLIMPLVIYMKLCDMGEENERIALPMYKRIFHYEVVCVATVAGIAATYVNLLQLLSPKTFTWPCYVPTYTNTNSTE